MRLRQPLERPTGSAVVYSDLNFITLGAALEEVGGARLDVLAKREVFGAVGVDALAAVSVFFPVMFFFISFVMGLSSGATVLIGQAWGAGEPERVKAVAGTTLTIALFGSAIIAIFGGLFSRQFLAALATPPDILEEASAYARLADTFGLTHEAIAMRLGRSRAAVTNTVRLLNLAPEVQRMITAGSLTAGHGRALLGMQSHGDQIELAATAEAMGMSVRQVEFAVARRREGFTARQRASVKSVERSPDELALEHGLQEALGAPVHVERRGARGRVIIEFFSEAELDGLYARLGGPPL